MIGRFRIVAPLALVWMALWESADLGTALAGVAVGLVAVRLVPPRRSEALAHLRPVPAIRLLGFFLRKLVQATMLVAWEVITPRTRTNQGIVAVPMHGASDGIITLVANIISLTPGTLTLEVRRDPATLYVHVLHLRSVEEVRLEARRFEEMAIAAFPPGEVTEGAAP